MKKNQFVRHGMLVMLAAGISPAIWAQTKQIAKTDFVVLKTGTVAFKPYTAKDFNSDPKKTENDLITLPNKKQIKLSDYLNMINTVEKNLADIGYDAKQIKGTTLVAQYKPKLAVALPAQLTTDKLQPLSTATVQQRFTTASINNSLIIPTRNVLIKQLKIAQVVNRNETPDPYSFTVGDYNVKFAPSFTMTGNTDVINFSNDNQRNKDTLTAFVKNKNNTYSLGLNIDLSTNIPVLGNVTVYSLQSDFQARSSKDSSHHSTVKLKVLEQVLILENKKITTDNYSFTQQRSYNLNKLIGTADIFMYGLNLVSPVNFYMTGTVGGSFDVDISRTGITGQMGPTIGQSIILESSVLDAIGAGALQNNALDAGVGGELKLIQGTLNFAGSTGITAVNKKIQLLNDVYTSFDLALLQGRLYTYVSYPAYLCNSIFSAADPNCWGIRRIENNLFSTSAATQFQLTLADDNQNVDLNW
ncbi:MAG: hypothetical protein JST75_12285 [Bacteroidetes bacterium]|nr:hypothetical protein [Bacteroidota bacterium]